MSERLNEYEEQRTRREYHHKLQVEWWKRRVQF